MACESHELLLDTITRIQNTQEKLADEVAESNVRGATQELTLKSFVTEFRSMREENERYETIHTERLDKLYLLVQREQARTKWRPSHFVAIISGMIVSAGGVMVAWIQKAGQ